MPSGSDAFSFLLWLAVQGLGSEELLPVITQIVNSSLTHPHLIHPLLLLANWMTAETRT